MAPRVPRPLSTTPSFKVRPALGDRNRWTVAPTADTLRARAEIQNAYETLSDPDSRARYDRFGSSAGSGSGGGMDEMDEDDLMDAFFGNAFGGGGARRGPAGASGGPQQRRKTQTQPSKVDLKVSLEE